MRHHAHHGAECFSQYIHAYAYHTYIHKYIYRCRLTVGEADPPAAVPTSIGALNRPKEPPPVDQRPVPHAHHRTGPRTGIAAGKKKKKKSWHPYIQGNGDAGWEWGVGKGEGGVKNKTSKHEKKYCCSTSKKKNRKKTKKNTHASVYTSNVTEAGGGGGMNQTSSTIKAKEKQNKKTDRGREIYGAVSYETLGTKTQCSIAQTMINTIRFTRATVLFPRRRKRGFARRSHARKGHV